MVQTTGGRPAIFEGNIDIQTLRIVVVYRVAYDVTVEVQGLRISKVSRIGWIGCQEPSHDGGVVSLNYLLHSSAMSIIPTSFFPPRTTSIPNAFIACLSCPTITI